jgi:hypothetical protein
VNLFRTQTFMGSPLDVDLGARIAPHSHHGDGPQSIVGGPAATTIQAMPAVVDAVAMVRAPAEPLLAL